MYVCFFNYSTKQEVQMFCYLSFSLSLICECLYTHTTIMEYAQYTAIYSFIQQTFIKHLPYAQHYARHLAFKKRIEHTFTDQKGQLIFKYV